jgi:hypothetical protein
MTLAVTTAAVSRKAERVLSGVDRSRIVTYVMPGMARTANMRTLVSVDGMA